MKKNNVTNHFNLCKQISKITIAYFLYRNHSSKKIGLSSVASAFALIYINTILCSRASVQDAKPPGFLGRSQRMAIALTGATRGLDRRSSLPYRAEG
jgi:hypothetical protein